MKYSIVGSNKTTTREEKAAAYIFIACAALSIIAVVSITAYMIISGTPAIFKVGLVDILFSTVWQPTAGKFGILYIILTSIIGTFFAVLLAVPIGLLTAVALSELVNEKFKKVLKSAIEMLAGIPSVVYGLLGILIINPAMYALEKSPDDRWRQSYCCHSRLSDHDFANIGQCFRNSP